MKTTPPLSCIIIDDEPKAIDILTQLINQAGLAHQITSHSELTAAKLAIVKDSPDVIFLDIHMPHKSGIDFHDELRAIGIKSSIVFVTAYDQYAIQALKRHAYDYLVKPVDYEELVECLSRLHTDVNTQKLKDQAPIR
ncbi:MAG: response regulator, partial [Bacteroidota bacterium]|nr:response regulator [Bacteroidota bacterium]